MRRNTMPVRLWCSWSQPAFTIGLYYITYVACLYQVYAKAYLPAEVVADYVYEETDTIYT